MSLSNSTWLDFATGKNVEETWVAYLYYDTETSSEVLKVSDRNFQLASDNLPVRGFVKNWGTIRRSIDLAKCTASVSNMTLTLENALYNGAKLAEELRPTATRKYLNRTVKVFSLLNGNYSSLMQVYHGRLRRVRWNSDTVTLDVEPNQPWDFLTIPTVKHASGLHYPFVYGGFDHNSSEIGTQAFCTSMALWPVQVSDYGLSRLNGLVFEGPTGTMRLHSWEESIQQFVPISDSTPAFIDDAIDDATGDIVQADSSFHLGVKAKCVFRDHPDNGWSNPERAFDTPRATGGDYASTLLTCSTSIGGGLYKGESDLHFDLPALTAKYYGDKTIAIFCGSTWFGTAGDVALKVFNASGEIDTETINNDGSDYIELTIPAAADTSTLYLQAIAISSSAGRQVLVSATDVMVIGNAKLDSASDEQAILTALGRIKTLYCGGDGLPKSYSSGAVTQIHEMHRDLLYRVAGYTAAPDNWSALDTARTGWLVRWWANKPLKLGEVLEQAQYEGGFVFTWSPTGVGRYVYVKSSYTSGDLAATLKPGVDTGEIEYDHTGFDELTTKQVVSYQRHPADEGRFLAEHTETNATARASWGIQSEENVAQVQLEMLAGAADEWAAYQDNLVGDLKQHAKIPVVNHLHRVLEIADVIKIDGDLRYYMVVEEERSPGGLLLSCEEVG